MAPRILVPKREWLPVSEGTIHDEVVGLERVEPAVWIDRLVAGSGFGLPRRHVVERWRTGTDAVAQLDRAVARTGAELVYFEFGYDADALPSPRARRLGVPVVVALRGADTSLYVQTHGLDYRRLALGVDLFLCRSEEMRKRVAALGVPEHKLRVHHSGIRAAAFPLVEPSPAERVRLLCCCRFVAKKGVEDLLLALASLEPRVRSRAHLDLVGDGPLRSRYTSLIDELGIAGAVVVAAAVPRRRVADLLRRADTVVLPSRTSPGGDREGIPVILMEALASGRRVISTVHAGIPELVRRREWGLLVPEGDPPALGRAIEAFVDDPERCRAGRVAARDHVLRHFDADVQRRRLEEQFRSLIE